MNNLKLLLILIITIVVVACESLDEVPLSSLAPSTFYKTSVQVQAAYTASMDGLFSQWSTYSYGFGNFPYDDQYASYGSEQGTPLSIPYNKGTELWNIHYKAILNINTALKAVQGGSVADATESQANELIGMGKFLRAYNYFMLVRMFGAVPLYLEEDNPGFAPEARAPIEEVYASIISDFTDAAQKLPLAFAGKPGLPTQGAANGLLAKAYLTMATFPLNDASNYQKAADAAKKVMDSGQHSLVPDVREVFLPANGFSPEMMWSFIATNDDDITPAQVFAPPVAPYYGWQDSGIQPEFADNYPEQPRKDSYLMLEVDGVTYKDPEWGTPRPSIRKYLMMTLAEYNGFKSGSDIPIIRYADVLLIFAEAENMAKGTPTQAAVDAINQVIDRANDHVPNPAYPLLTTSMSKEEFDKAVIHERSLELVFEYDRWFDIIRKRILLETTNYPQTFTEDDYLYPIPEPDLRLNPLLTQNPGYPLPGGG